MKLLSVVSAAALALTLASGQAFAGSHGGGDFDAAYKAAEDARKKAKSVGGEWRDIGKFLKKAKKLAKEDKAKAMKLVAKAKFQAEMGYKQAMEQAGKDLTPPYLK